MVVLNKTNYSLTVLCFIIMTIVFGGCGSSATPTYNDDEILYDWIISRTVINDQFLFRRHPNHDSRVSELELTRYLPWWGFEDKPIIMDTFLENRE